MELFIDCKHLGVHDNATVKAFSVYTATSVEISYLYFKEIHTEFYTNINDQANFRAFI